MKKEIKTQYASLSKNHCHHPLVAPSKKEMDFGIIGRDRIFGIFTGTNLYEDEDTGEIKGWSHITGFTLKALKDFKENFPDLSLPKCNYSLTRFDLSVLLGLLGKVQHTLNIAKSQGKEPRVIDNYRLNFPSIYALGKSLGLPNTPQYHKRLLDSICKLFLFFCRFNGNYYDWKEKKVLTNKDICFKFFSYMEIDKETGEINIEMSPAWVDSQGGYNVTLFFSDAEQIKSEIDLNLFLMMQAWDDQKIKRELTQLCDDLGFKKGIPKIEMRRGLKKAIESLNKTIGKVQNYQINIKKTVGKEVVSLMRQTLEEWVAEEDRKEREQEEARKERERNTIYDPYGD